MPQSKSAKKSLRQSKVRRSANIKKRKTYRVLARELRELAAAGKKVQAEKVLPKFYKAVDKAAKKSAIHKNTAARYKSRLTTLVNKVVPKKVVSKKKSVKAKK